MIEQQSLIAQTKRRMVVPEEGGNTNEIELIGIGSHSYFGCHVLSSQKVIYRDVDWWNILESGDTLLSSLDFFLF